MSFANCIDQAISVGKLSKTLGEEIKRAENPEQAIDDLFADMTRQKREAAIQAVRMSEAMANMDSHKDGAYHGLLALMTKDKKQKAGYANVEYLAKNYEARFQSRFADALSAFRTRRLGLSQDYQRLAKLVRAIYGETVDDVEVTKWAKDWSKLTEEMRTEFNAKGGSISKNERYLLPQNHDARAIGKFTMEEWRDKIKPMLDKGAMTDDLGKPLSDADLDDALAYSYESITTHGLNKVKDLTMPKLGKKLSRKGSEKRFLYFKDAESWLEYQKEFGKGDIFTTLTDSISTKAHDIAMMEVFGPSPDTTFRALKGAAEKRKPFTNVQNSFSNAIWNVTSGKVNQGELTNFADFMQSTRNVLTASTLGAAFLSSVSDIGMQAITSQFNNIPAYKTLARQMSLLNPANEADRILSVKMGLTAEAWLGRAQAANRYADVYGTGPTTKIAEGVMRGSLLAPWTDAGRKAFGMEFSAMLADNFGKEFDQLNKKMLRAFKAYGIDEAAWDKFRKQKHLEYKGAKYADMTLPEGVKFHQMVMSETDYAVPSPDATVRAITTAGTERATATGQIVRSIMNLKSFPITIATTHFYRIAHQATMGEKLSYAAALFTSSTILGAVALQAKDIAAGREPRPIDDTEQGIKFFGAAVSQGGGLGIFGDFLFSDVNRFGGGPVETAFGPTGELATKTFSLTWGNVQQAIKGEETNVLGEGVDFIKRYTPDIWQTRLFTDAVFDQIRMQADPDTQRKFNRMVKKRYKEYEQGYWWRPGETLPEALQ